MESDYSLVLRKAATLGHAGKEDARDLGIRGAGQEEGPARTKEVRVSHKRKGVTIKGGKSRSQTG